MESVSVAAGRKIAISGATFGAASRRNTLRIKPRQASRLSGPRQRGDKATAGRAGYTIAHAGRQVRFGPVAFWIAVGTVVIMAGWSVTAATYFAFRDDVLRSLIARQAAQQFAYEDRIAELRAQIDRTTSRQLLDQEQFEQKLDELTRRQATLESRANCLGRRRRPGNDRLDQIAGREAGHRSRPLRRAADRGRQSSIGAALGRLEASLDRVDRRQSATLDQMDRSLQKQGPPNPRRARQLGVKVDAAPAAVGGPFVPVKLPAGE